LIASAVVAPFLLGGFVLSWPARGVLDAGRTRRGRAVVAATSAVLLIGRSAIA